MTADARPPAEADVVTPPETPWRRLDPRMLVVTPVAGLTRLLPAFAVVLVAGRGDGDLSRVWFSLAAAAAVVVLGALRWRFTRYRITADRVELHSGWLRRQRRSVPRDRIRTVDLTSRLEHRVFGLSVVKVGAAAGTGHDDGLALDAVSRTEAERLRGDLLDRRAALPVAPTATGTGPAVTGAAAPGAAETATAAHRAAHGSPANGAAANGAAVNGSAVNGCAANGAAATTATSVELARLDWRWIRFAPLTFSSLAGVGVIAGSVLNLLGDLGVDAGHVGADAVGGLARAGLAAAIGVVAVTVLGVGVLGSLVLFARRWYGYRLTREPDRTLRVRRGLLTRRSLSVAQQRLRGVELVEPLLLRAGGGGQVRALSAGLARDTQGGVLQPPVPRAEADRVAAAVTGATTAETTGAPLRRHPPAARRRRLARALGPTAAVVAAAFALDDHLVGPVSVVLLPIMALVGRDRARQLGHAVTGGYLVARQGSLVRRTVALQRSGVIGWTVRQSILQRRAGVVTVEAVTAAGSGAYRILDLAAADADPLLTAVNPAILTGPAGAPRPATSHPVDPALDIDGTGRDAAPARMPAGHGHPGRTL